MDEILKIPSGVMQIRTDANPEFVLEYEAIFRDGNGNRSAGTTRHARIEGDLYKTWVEPPSVVRREPAADNAEALIIPGDAE
jgi:hypothetical protein